MNKPDLNNNWIDIYDGKNWWFLLSNDGEKKYPNIKGRIYCFSCYQMTKKLSQCLVYRKLGCNGCGKVPPEKLKALAKLLQI